MLRSVFFRAWTWLANIDQILSSTTQADDTSTTTKKEHRRMTGKRSTGGAGVGGAGTGTVRPQQPPRSTGTTATSTAGKTASTQPISTTTTNPSSPSSSSHSRHQTHPGSSPPSSPMSPTATSKLPRFLQSPTQRDRSKSLSLDPPRPPSSASTSSSAGPRRNAGRFLGIGRDKERERERERIREAERGDPSAAELLAMEDDDVDSPMSAAFDYTTASSPPSAYATARPRTRSDRPFSVSTPPGSSSSHSSHSHSSHSSPPTSTLQVVRSPSRLSAGGEGGLTTRLSGWFSHISGSTSDLSLTSTIGAAATLATSTSRNLSSSARKAPSSSSSRKSDTSGSGKGGGGGLLDKAVRYLLDGDANPDRSTAEIWLMGVRMEGWSRDDEERFARSQQQHLSSSKGHSHPHHHHHDPNSDLTLPDPGPWPAAFHAAFYAQVWCTYRAGFPEPIRDLAGLEVLGPPLCFPPSPHSHLHVHPQPPPPGIRAPPMHSPTQSDASASSYASSSPTSSAHGHGHGPHSSSSHSTSSTTSSGKKRWWPLSLGNTGSSKGWSSDAGWGCMLRTAQSLLATAVGRVGAPPLLPCPPTPFPPTTPSAHALHARLLSWFADAPIAPFSVHRMALAGKKAGKDVGMWFGPSAAGLAVRTLVDGFPTCGLGVALAQDSTLYQTDVFAASHSSSSSRRQWGDRPVLLLLGIRLGLDGVNPVYYDTIKALFTFPQSVGIAGGRPSSSYYFVGIQDDGLFYLDPHHSRPTVPLRPYVEEDSSSNDHRDRGGSMSPDWDRMRAGSMSPERGGSMSPELVHRGGSLSPDPPARRRSPMREDELVYNPRRGNGSMSAAEEAHWARAYPVSEMRTFHCERVRKMPMSGLDPSMLIGFLVRDEVEWVDLRRRLKELPRTIFAIQDEPPSWGAGDDDDELGMDGISDPEEEPVVEVDVDVDDGDLSSASHGSNWSHPPAFSKQTHVHSGSASTTHTGSSASQVDTEEDAMGPITPLPGSSFDLGRGIASGKGGYQDADGDGDGDADDFVDADEEIEDDWVDPVSSPPVSVSPPVLAQVPAPPASTKKSSSSSTSSSSTSTSKTKTKTRSSKSKSKKPVPVPSVHYPFPGSGEDVAVAVVGERERERDRNVTVVAPKVGGGGQRRARDGGRTQSGGVRGILTED